MSKNRWLPAESLVKKKLAGGVGNMVFSADDVGYLHQSIINNHRKIIGRHTIRSDNDRVANKLEVKLHLSPHQIIESDQTSIRDFEPDSRLFASLEPVLSFLEGDIPAAAAVDRRASFRQGLLPFFSSSSSGQNNNRPGLSPEAL